MVVLALGLLAWCAPVSAAVNINTASVKELTSLPFIGVSRAKAIVRYRRYHGPFYELAALAKVEGIGAKTLIAIKPLVTLDGREVTPASPPPALPMVPEETQAISIRSGQIMLLPNDSYYPVLLRFIRGARYRIDLAMYLFKKGKGRSNRPKQVAQALVRARKRGVKVRVVLEKSGWNDNVNIDNRQVAHYLRQHKVAVRFDSLARTTHSKVVVIDQRFCFVGSHNFTHSALQKNNEMSLLLDSPKVARQLQGYIQAIR